MNSFLSWFGAHLARYLAKEVHVDSAAPATVPARLLATLRPGDVLLVEGHSRVSTAIKYLTQSTWSHAALYVGNALAAEGKNPQHCFIEADTVEGVRSVGMDAYVGLHSRICRPVGLSAQECQSVIAFAINRIGSQYDLRNVIDLARYLLPTPPVPLRFRRNMLALGSGDPTRAICSTLIAQAFQSIRYPILPITTIQNDDRPDCPACVNEILRVRHHSLFAPRDFDVSPYFQVIKPTIEVGFDFHALTWGDVTTPNS
ncbi:MAG: lipo-like protein [Betaproteobacteria bacterium]|nr:lipo-like protein [Betaproteobacteria bacterium]NCP81332.1 lipo-like protein [Rhodoferax sp.]NCS60794.1 lipo-like protein [Rhodoferax sp.]PIZ22920.1 MAG: lipo-like protein [Comamonadaceae bacterium CG_4_10_14_0_8_um_filter_57_29]PJC15004.1 MAG: lipo-like protein [Comamonadaceae bacterium CG_4_9_14_0_8_um_filter_57_21]